MRQEPQTDAWSVTVFWGNRAESAEDARGRLLLALLALAPLDERFESWFVEDDYRGRPVLWDVRGASPLGIRKLAGLKATLVLGQEEVSVTSTSVKLVNGRSGRDAAEMTFSYGLSNVPSGMWFPNSLGLTFHAEELDPLLDPPAARSVLAAVARHMNPLAGAFLTTAHARRHASDLFEGRITAGWLTFLAARLGAVPHQLKLLTSPEHDGSIVQITSRLLMAKDERQIAAADQVSRVFAEWGHLRSTGDLQLAQPLGDE